MTTTDTAPATVKDAAAAIRRDLKAAFPGAKFNVRMGTGTASTWIDVKWTDGPNRDMVKNVTDRYEEFGSPVEGVSHERHLSTGVLMQAQDMARAALPDLTVFDADGRYITDGPGHAPVFHLGGWRFGGGSAYSALSALRARPEGLYGLELAKVTGIGPGLLYPDLVRLEERGWVRAWWGEPVANSGPRRRYYGLTGRTVPDA